MLPEGSSSSRLSCYPIRAVLTPGQGRDAINFLLDGARQLERIGGGAQPEKFVHLILLQQVEEKFITGYQVFERRPNDASLVDSILKRHHRTLGQLPESFTADKGFYQSMEKLRTLERTIPNVSIAKKGSRTEAETAREHHPIFRALQRFG